MSWIAGVTSDHRLASLLHEITPPENTVVVRSRWKEWSAPLPAAIVFGGRDVTPHSVEIFLRDATVLNVMDLVVALVPLTAEMARVLAGAGCGDVIWTEDHDATVRLQAALTRKISVDPRRRMWEMLHSRCYGDSVLIRVASEAFGRSRLPPTVGHLARRSFCGVSTLRSHWHSASLPESPQALIEWATVGVLLSARGREEHHRSDR